MLRFCLDDRELVQLLFRAAEDCARARMPNAVMKAFMFATMTALQKPDGEGVRSIATGTSFRSLVARCFAWQFGKAVESACSVPVCPFHKGRNRLRGVCGPSSHRREPRGDSVVS